MGHRCHGLLLKDSSKRCYSKNCQRFCGDTGKRTIFAIKLTQGQAREITRYSLVASEDEVLLPPFVLYEAEQAHLAAAHRKRYDDKEAEDADPAPIGSGVASAATSHGSALSEAICRLGRSAMPRSTKMAAGCAKMRR